MRPSALALVSTAFAALAACGSSGSDAGAATGAIDLVLTDAASEDLEVFEVDVGDIVFTRSDQSTVSVLSRRTRVDFVQLQTLSELVAGLSIPAGVYTRIDLMLDFSTAVVSIKGQTAPAAVLDAGGAPITGTVPVQVDFATGARPAVRVARRHLFVLDLDLDQGVTVDTGLNTVTFTPVLGVEFDPSNPRPVATTGFLNSVDLTQNRFVVERRAVDGTAIAQFTVAISSTTVFQVDGQNAVGSVGLGNLVPQIGNRIFVQGALDATQPRLNAVAVEAGAGVPGGGQDWVLGHVVARDNGSGSDASLTVLGHSRVDGSGTRQFNTLHTVTVTHAATKVLRRGTGGTLDSDDLNVGQLVWAFGSLTGTTLDATAATGVVRMLRTSIFGVAAGPASGNQLTLNLSRFDLRPIGSFDFDVGGNPEAVPASFTVDVTGLDTTGVTAGSRIRAIGFVNPVGVGGDANAAAVSFVNHSTQAKVLFCQWSPASGTAIDSASDSAVTLDLGGASVHAVGDGFAPVTVNASPAPALVPLGAIGIYRIVQDGAVELNLGFGPFAQSLQNRAATSDVFRIAALGTYEPTTQVFSASVITVVLQ